MFKMASFVEKKAIAVLIDLSGTLHVGNHATNNAVKALKRSVFPFTLIALFYLANH